MRKFLGKIAGALVAAAAVYFDRVRRGISAVFAPTHLRIPI